MASPYTEHQEIVFSVAYGIRRHMEKRKIRGKVFVAPLDVKLQNEDNTIVQPDVLVVKQKDKIYKKYINGSPDMVIEVLSFSTSRKDLSFKLEKYSSAGVKEYWVIDYHHKLILAYDLTTGEFEIHNFDCKLPVKIFDNECIINFSKIKKDIERYIK